MARFTEVRSTVHTDCSNEEVNVYLMGWYILTSTEPWRRYVAGGARWILSEPPRRDWEYSPNRCVSWTSPFPVCFNGLKRKGIGRLGKEHCYFFLFEKTKILLPIKNTSIFYFQFLIFFLNHGLDFPICVTNREHVRKAGGNSSEWIHLCNTAFLM